MKIKKIIALVLAAVMAVSCVALTGCSRTKDSSKPRLEKRTAVYSQEKLDYSLDGSINGAFADGDYIYMTYNEVSTLVRDNYGEEVERFSGYYYEYYGNMEPDDGFVVYAEEAVYGTVYDGFSGALSSATPVYTDDEESGLFEPYDGDADADIGSDDKPLPVDADWERPVLEGEPDEFGVIIDENKNISVPDGWWIDYDYSDSLDRLNIKTGEKQKISLDIKNIDGIPSENTYLAGSCPDGNGNLIFVVQAWNWDEVTTEESAESYFVVYDLEECRAEKVIDVAELLKSFSDEIDMQYLYVGNIQKFGQKLGFMIDGAIYLCDYGFENVQKIDMGDNYLDNVYTTESDVLVSYYDMNWTTRRYGKLVDGKLEPFDSEVLTQMSQSYWNVIGASGSRIFMQGQSGVAYYDMETDTFGEELNYINSDIDSSDVNTITYLGDGRMMMLSTRWDVGVGETTAYLLTKVPDEDLGEEVIIKIASLYNNYELARTAIAFNRLNTGVRVSIISYDKYNNEENEWTGAVTQLNGEITSGNLPDIVMLDSSLPVESYFRKGVFTDLNRYIDDEEVGIDRADYLDNIFRAGEIDGKLYSAIGTFYLSTLAAKSKFVGKEPGWTFEEFVDMLTKMPEGMQLIFGQGRDRVLYTFTQEGLSTFVDWNTGKTKFNTPEFVKFIEYLKSCPEKGLWDEYYDSMGDEWVYDDEKERELSEKYTLQYWNDTSLIRNTTIFTFNEIVYMYNEFASKDVTMIGFPCDEGNGAIISPIVELAISAKSPVKDQAWEFVRYVLESGSDGYAFPVNRKLMEEKRHDDTDPVILYKGTYDYDVDYEWMREYGYSEDYINFSMNSHNEYEDSMGDEIMKIAENASVIMRFDEELADIISEELSSFFAGTRSAEDTARIIDSRVSIIISE